MMQAIILLLHKSLCTETAVINSGFFLGFIYTLKLNKKTLDYPLTSLANASINGIFTSYGALVASAFIPKPMHFSIPVTVIASCIYYKYKDIKNR